MKLPPTEAPGRRNAPPAKPGASLRVSSRPASPHGAAEPTDGELLGRFAKVRDRAALELLVRRHGPMVLGVCRRLLGPGPDADDAFQATFLVLVRKGATLRRPGLVANWLYGVALRVARKARALGRRRRDREEPMIDLPARTADLAGQPTPLRSGPVRGVMDLVSGAHTAGSRLTAILLPSRSQGSGPARLGPSGLDASAGPHATSAEQACRGDNPTRGCAAQARVVRRKSGNPGLRIRGGARTPQGFRRGSMPDQPIVEFDPLCPLYLGPQISQIESAKICVICGSQRRRSGFRA